MSVSYKSQIKPSEDLGVLELSKETARCSESEGSLTQDIRDPWNTDPANPRNWRPGKKWAVTAIVSRKYRIIIASPCTHGF